MKPRLLVLLLAVLAGLSWWWLRPDAEDRVRAAHQDLARLLSKSADDGAKPIFIDSLRFQAMFADSCELSGEAGGLIGAYTPEAMAGLIIRTRSLFERIDLDIGELAVELRAPDDALARFTAELTASSASEDRAPLSETRSVISRMQRVDGDWRFAEFRFELPAGE